ncbi:MAG: formylglycine-generating enzyme family protein [Acidobacteria bacterium]|nr:formylglycine-generating enzyme family protein [Acidobacteriota bacterium]
MHRAILALVGLATAVILIAVAGARLVAPGPPAFYVEPDTRMVLVAIEPGSFVMGSPASEAGRNDDEQPHRITLSRRIYMGRYEVTQTEWQMVMGANPSRFSDCARCPVEQVNFYDVDDFLTRLTARSSAMRYRLPTEAEWEYACRAGTSTAYGLGDQLEARDANFNASPGEQVTPGSGAYRTRPVGSFAPNAWGLHDMHGNVWEWTNDFYGPYDAQADVDPRGPQAGTTRVIRGGSWYFDAASARCAQRYTHAPQDRGFSLGFRVVGEPVERAR